MISKKDKLRILARLFYCDNPDEYEDYHEALAEFMNTNNTSDKFVDVVVERLITPKQGHFVLMRDDGHVAEVRDSDGLFLPRTEMTMTEGAAFEEQYKSAIDEYPKLEGMRLLEKMGWRLIANKADE